jgi:hypothetical protein
LSCRQKMSSHVTQWSSSSSSSSSVTSRLGASTLTPIFTIELESDNLGACFLSQPSISPTNSSHFALNFSVTSPFSSFVRLEPLSTCAGKMWGPGFWIFHRQNLTLHVESPSPHRNGNFIAKANKILRQGKKNKSVG